jgi:hypothetical protein
VRYFALLVLPFAFAVSLALCLALVPDASRGFVLDLHIRSARTLAFAGAIVAALAFRPGERMRRAWLLTGASYFLLLERDAVLYRLVSPAVQQAIEPFVVVLANLAGVAGCWLFARAWKRAGLELPGSPGLRGLARGTAIVVAMGITVPSLVQHATDLAAGHGHALVGVASNLGDIVVLSLIVPVLLTALALRGGEAAWPFALFTASQLAWLCFDATVVVSAMNEARYALLLGMAEVFRVLACTLAFAAGLAQWLSAPLLSGPLARLR